eukprot:g9034.t1
MCDAPTSWQSCNPAISWALRPREDPFSAKDALQASNFDPEAAAELLLLAGAADDLGLSASSTSGSGTTAAATAERGTRNRWGKKAAVALQDEELALRLQFEDDGHWGCCAAVDDAVLAAQLEEERLGISHGLIALGLEDGPYHPSMARSTEAETAALLQQQFEEYEQQMNRADAERWHGKGDLMESNFARENLSLPTMDKVTCWSIGHGQITEKAFFELLQLNSIRVLYDFRASDHRGDVRAPCEHFAVRALKSSCRMRGIVYKHVALGRESAYGILKHVQTDEAQHALIELAWHAKRQKTCFLGFDPDWHLDARQVVADEMLRAGHRVWHIAHAGEAEEHGPVNRKLPDFLVQEEERLRKLEKQRQAGELLRPEKSVDRSSEAVASKLMQPSKEPLAFRIDAMDELRAASNQMELERVQRNLARQQRLGEKYGLLESKGAADHTDVPVAGSPVEEETSSHEQLMVECSSCTVQQPWDRLAEGDGLCAECLSQADLLTGLSHLDEETLAQLGAEKGVFVEEHEASASCSTCDSPQPSPDVAKPGTSVWRRRAKATASGEVSQPLDELVDLKRPPEQQENRRTRGVRDRQDREKEALQVVHQCAKAAAHAVASASRRASTERAKLSEDKKELWDQAWAHASVPLLIQWREEAVHGNLLVDFSEAAAPQSFVGLAQRKREMQVENALAAANAAAEDTSP